MKSTESCLGSTSTKSTDMGRLLRRLFGKQHTKTEHLVGHRLTNSTSDRGYGRQVTPPPKRHSPQNTAKQNRRMKPPWHETNPPLCHLTLTPLTIAMSTHTDRLEKKKKPFEMKISTANSSARSYTSLAHILTESSFADVIKANHPSAVPTAAMTFLALFAGSLWCVASQNPTVSASAWIHATAYNFHTPQATTASPAQVSSGNHRTLSSCQNL